MLTDKEILLLQSQNNLLQIQVQEAEMILAIREEELELLRNRAREATAMQSELNNNLTGFDQLQRHIGNSQLKSEAAARMLEATEAELCSSIQEQLQYAEAVKDMHSLEANLADTNLELQEASKLYKQKAALRSLLAEAQSDLEIATLTITNLKEELAEAKALNKLLLQKGKGGAPADI